jgi:hypothetical protein
MKLWKVVLLVLAGIALATWLTYGVLQATKDLANTIALGLSGSAPTPQEQGE